MLYGASKSYEPNILHLSKKLHQCSALRNDVYLLQDINTFASKNYLKRYKQSINSRIDRIMNKKYLYNTNILYAIVDRIIFYNQYGLDNDHLMYSYGMILNRKPSLLVQTNSYGFSALSTLLFGLKYYKDYESSEDAWQLLNYIFYYTLASGYGKYFEDEIARKHMMHIMKNEKSFLICFVASTFVSSGIFDAEGAYGVYEATRQLEDKIKPFQCTSGIRENLNVLDYIATLEGERRYTWHTLQAIVLQNRFWGKSPDKILCTNNSFANLELYSFEAIKCIDYYKSDKIPGFVIVLLFEIAACGKTMSLMNVLLNCKMKDYIHYTISSIIHKAAQTSKLYAVHLLKAAFYKDRNVNYIRSKEDEYRSSHRVHYSTRIYKNFIIYFFITHPAFKKQQNFINCEFVRGMNNHILWQSDDSLYNFMSPELKIAQKNLCEHENIRSIIARRKGEEFIEQIGLLQYISTSLFTRGNIIDEIITRHLSFLQKFNNLNTIQCIFQCLISNGCNIEKDVISSAMEEAVKQGYAKVVQALINIGEDCNHKVWHSDENMLILAVKQQYSDVVRVLVKAGAKLDYRDRKGMTALMHCIRNFDLESFNILVAAGASQNFEGENQEYLFASAIEMHNLKYNSLFRNL